MDARDQIGKRGEYIACLRLMDFCGNPRAYFNPYMLGEKCPVFDLLVELEGTGDSAAYFLAQVKATAKGSGQRSANLRVEVTGDHVEKMVRSPFPTYLIGIDEPAERAYVVSIHGTMTGPIHSMPRRYLLTAENLKALWEEVLGFWNQFPLATHKSSRFRWSKS